MEEKSIKLEEPNRVEPLKWLPEPVLLDILSLLDLDSLCSASAACKPLRSAVSQIINSLASLDLTGFSPREYILNRVIRDNNVLRSLTLDCSRLDDRSIELFAKETLQELVLLKCLQFSSRVFTVIGEKCPNLRLLKLEVDYHYELEPPSACKKAIEQLLMRCLHLESLFMKFPNQNTGTGDVQSLKFALPKTMKHLLLQPVSNHQALLFIPMVLGLQSLTLVLDRITDELLITIAGTLHLLSELCLEDRPMEQPSQNNDLTNYGLQSLCLCMNLTHLSLTRSRENFPATFTRVNDIGIFLLAEGCKGLESIRFGGFSKVTDAGYASFLHSCKNLKRFEIANAFFLSDLSFHDLVDAPSSLVDVRLISCNLLTSETAQCLSFCRNLEVLNLSGCRSIADLGLYSIANMCKLTTLDLSGSDITDNGLIVLGGATSPISSLCLRNCKRINNRGLSLLFRGDGAISRTLSTLDLGYLPGVSDRAIIAIAEACKQLTNLCIRHCYFVTFASIKVLGSPERFAGEGAPIRRLDLYNCCGLSPDSFDLPTCSLFPGLRWLGAGSTRWSGKGQEKLLQLFGDRPGLSICLSGCEIGCQFQNQVHEFI